jgi:hypothetical protein
MHVCERCTMINLPVSVPSCPLQPAACSCKKAAPEPSLIVLESSISPVLDAPIVFVRCSTHLRLLAPVPAVRRGPWPILLSSWVPWLPAPISDLGRGPLLFQATPSVPK